MKTSMKTSKIELRVEPQVKASMQAVAAEKYGMDLSNWMRLVLAKAAERDAISLSEKRYASYKNRLEKLISEN
jgi:antitoxin component of RelBE/YafQ-DinJ toxin-antitoxin module